jgi:hypothetical protein
LLEDVSQVAFQGADHLCRETHVIQRPANEATVVVPAAAETLVAQPLLPVRQYLG